MRSWLMMLAVLPGLAAAQSSREEAWRWCQRQDQTIGRDTQIAGCTWAISSGREPAANLAIAFYNRGVAREAQGDRAGAIADYSEAVRHNPQDALAFNNRGVMREAQGDRAGAIADYNEAIRHNHQFAIAFNNRGAARAAQGDRAGAIADYDEAIRINPQRVLALVSRAILRQRIGEAEGARSDIEAAIRVAAPTSGLPHAARAGLALLRGDQTAAAADLAEALRRDAGDPLALALRAVQRQRQGDATGADADAAAARRNWPPIGDYLSSHLGLALP